MTKKEMIDLLNELVELEERNDIGSLLRSDRREFQYWIDEIINAVPVAHGKWIYEGARGRFTACRCSVCGNVENADWAMISGEVNFCPNCGAKMDGERGADDSRRP